MQVIILGGYGCCFFPKELATNGDKAEDDSMNIAIILRLCFCAMVDAQVIRAIARQRFSLILLPSCSHLTTNLSTLNLSLGRDSV